MEFMKSLAAGILAFVVAFAVGRGTKPEPAEDLAVVAEREAERERGRVEAERAHVERFNVAKYNAASFWGLMRKAKADGLIYDVQAIEGAPNSIEIRVTTEWLMLPREERRKTAIAMWDLWARVNERTEPRAELCKIRLLDRTGRRVGGSSDWGNGANVSVEGD